MKTRSPSRRLAFCISAVFFAPAPAATPDTSAPIVLRFSHTASAESPKGIAANFFKRTAEAKTHGRVRVDVFPNAELYRDKDEFEALQLGAVQLIVSSFTKFSALGLQDFWAMEMPYRFENEAEVHAFLDSPTGSTMLASLESKGMHGLGFWDDGFKQWTSNRPVRAPGDLRGLKICIRYTSVSVAEMRALSAFGQPLSNAETYGALKSGAVDATEHTPTFILALRLDEVQKYVSLSNHAYVGSIFVANRRFWERLPVEVRRALDEAAEEATQVQNSLSRRANAEAVQALRRTGRTGVIDLTAEERLQWKRALTDLELAQREPIVRVGPGANSSLDSVQLKK